MPPDSGAETDRAATSPDGAGVSPPPMGGAAATGPATEGDWAAQLTGKVEDVVSLVRDRTVRPAATAVRYLIFGLIALAVGTLVAILGSVFSLRILDTEVPAFRNRVWASYLVLAGIFWIGGLLLSKMRHPRD